MGHVTFTFPWAAAVITSLEDDLLFLTVGMRFAWMFQAPVRHEIYLMHYEWIGKPSEDLGKCLLSVSARLSLVLQSL